MWIKVAKPNSLFAIPVSGATHLQQQPRVLVKEVSPFYWSPFVFCVIWFGLQV